ncbi:ester cyclase [Georgenia thermotolerans]|nr:ester cyclase [Georgenia thermotolerans]
MMTTDERTAMLRRCLDELWNKGNVDACDELYAEHCMFHDPTFPMEGVAGMKSFVQELRAAQPDFHMDVHDVVCGEDMTATRYTCAATARNEFRGLAGTGKTYVMNGMDMSKWEGDRIVEQWSVYDMLGTLQQIGLLPERMGTGHEMPA